MHIYNTSHLAKVIEFTYITYITYITPPSQLLLTGVRKKLKKVAEKFGGGGVRVVYLQREQVMTVKKVASSSVVRVITR